MWNEKPLLECVDLLQGLTYCPQNVKSYGLLVLRSSNIQNGRLKFNDCVFVDCTVDESRYVKPKDILICVRNGSRALIGKSCVIDKAYNATFGAFMSVLRGDKNGYISHIFASDIVQNQIKNRSSATINQITKRDFEEIVIPIPTDENEQRRIAEALSDMDDLLTSMEKLIDKKRAIKQGAMQELLTGKRRLPGFEGEWVRKTVDDCLDEIIGGGTPARSNATFWNGDVPWVTVKDFTTFNSCSTQEYISDIGLCNSATHLISKRTPIIATRMGLGQIVVYDVDVAINQDLKALILNASTITDYFVFWFKSQKANLEAMGTGSTVKGITIEQLKEFPIVLPPTIAEQTSIAAILSDMDAEIDALTAKLNKLRSIKQGMMSELLTGRIRLTESEPIKADSNSAAPFEN